MTNAASTRTAPRSRGRSASIMVLRRPLRLTFTTPVGWTVLTLVQIVVFALPLVLAYALWAAERRGAVKRRLAVAALIEAAGLFSTVSRAAIIGTLVALVVVSLLQRRARSARPGN